MVWRLCPCPWPSPCSHAHIRPLPVNVILVVGHEKLNVEMQRAYGSHISVVKIPKSGGVRFAFAFGSPLWLNINYRSSS